MLLTPFEWMARGDKLLAEGRPEEAMRAYKFALDKDPRQPFAWAGLAACYHRMRQFEEARVALEKSLAQSPDEPAVLKMKAKLMMDFKRLGSAVELFDLLLKGDPKDEECRRLRAECLKRLQK